MTETVASLSAQLETLNAARAAGVTTTSYVANGVSRTVTYKSDIEMRNAQWDLQQRIAALQACAPRRTVLVSTNKGLPARLSYRNRFPEAPPDPFSRDDD